MDTKRAELRFADTKAGRTHYIPLSAPALALSRAIPRTPGNPYILPGKGPRAATSDEKAKAPAHLVNVSKPWNRVKTAATLARWREEPEAAAESLDLPPAIDDLRLHDLRRTVGSWLAQAGNSLHLIGRVLNHTNASTTQAYARFREDTVRTALEQHGARIIGSAGLTPPAEVAALAPSADRCGACGFWPEHNTNAPSGACVNRRSAFYGMRRAAKADACPCLAFDDEAPGRGDPHGGRLMRNFDRA